MLEASEYVTAGRRIILCVKNVAAGAQIAGHEIKSEEAKDLNRARDYLINVAERNNVKVYTTIKEMMVACLAELDDAADLGGGSNSGGRAPQMVTRLPELPVSFVGQPGNTSPRPY